MVLPLLVVAHPGHELCLHAWTSAVRPQLVVLTTGSRSGNDRSRLESCLAQARGRGLVPTSLVGAFVDRELYQQVMEGRLVELLCWAASLREILFGEATQTVVVDAWQGYSVAHDVTHLLTHLAVAMAEAESGRDIELLEFSPVPQDAWLRRIETECRRRVSLTPDQAAAKARDAWSHEDLRGEIESLGFAAAPHLLGEEMLYACERDWSAFAWGRKPYYETVGEERVAAGVYRQALTQAHFRAVAEPIIERIVDLRRSAPGRTAAGESAIAPSMLRGQT
jgi:hypothetical protein